MNYSRFSGSRFVLPLLLVISLIGFVSCDGAGPGLEETDCCPPKEPPEEVSALSIDSLEAICATDTTEGGEIVGVVSGGTPNTKWEITDDSTGSLIASGTVGEDTTFSADIQFDGSFSVSVEDNSQDTTRTAKAGAQLDCKTEDLQPGLSFETRCDVEKPGQLRVTAANGLTYYRLVNEAGDTIEEKSDIDPEEDQLFFFDGLPAGDYDFIGKLNGEKGELQPSINCGPGAISIKDSCVDEQGKFVVTSKFEFDVARVFGAEGNLIDEESGPEATFTDLPDGELTVEVEKNGITRDTTKSVSCDPDPPEKPSLIADDCSDQYDGILVYDVDPSADSYELRNGSDEAVKSGDVNGRSEIEFSGLADGEYYLVLFKNDISVQSDTTTVECDLVTEVCKFTFGGLKFVDSFGKAVEEILSETKKVLISVEPEKNPRIKASVLLDQGEQTGESYALRFTADGDTVITQRRPDLDNNGSGLRWVDDQFTMSDKTLAQLEQGKAYKLEAVHGCTISSDECQGGGQDVVFSTEEPVGPDNRTGGVIIIETDTKPDN